jgi:hypothetical protein
MFNENSGLVKIWVRWIQAGEKQLSDVPELSNLKTAVDMRVNS